LPTKGADAIEILLNDHQIIKGLLEDLTAGKNGTRKKTLEKLKSVLTIHNATEENLVYPAIAVVAGKKAESRGLYHETAEADTVVFQLDQLLEQADDAGFAKMAEAFRTAVLEHIAHEEESAFPHLRKNADPEQAESLTEHVREFRGSLHFEKP
jgi:hemerythrin superfamily protein